MKLLDFNLEKALKNPERVVFANGSKVVDFKYFPLAKTEYKFFSQDENGNIFRYKKNGKSNIGEILHLKLLPLTKTYYYCIFKDGFDEINISSFFYSKEEMYKVVSIFGDKILQEHSYNVEIPE